MVFALVFAPRPHMGSIAPLARNNFFQIDRPEAPPPPPLNMLKTMLWGALLIATSLLNTYRVLSKSDQNLSSYEQKTTCPYLGIRTKYDRFFVHKLGKYQYF